MKELIEYRERLVERLAQAAREFCTICGNMPSTASVEGDWTVHQIAAHVRDVDHSVYGVRVRRTLQDENPLLPGFDADDWMAKHYQPDEPLQEILDGFKASMDDLCVMLKAMPQEAWSRLSRHESMGEGLTLQLWVERSLAHIEEHLQSLSNLK